MKRFQSLLAVTAIAMAGLQAAFAQTTVLQADTMLDGKGGVQHHVNIVVEGTKISRIGGPVPSGAAIYKLGSLTVTPGLIDTHSHILWHFDKGRFVGTGNGEPPLQAILYGVDNAVVTVDSGFTTIQSPGAPDDKFLRDALARDIIPGPHLLTSLQPLQADSGGPDKLRELVRERKAQGADFIKVFASKSIREGGAQTMTDAQLQAACGEAKALGLRTIVHAHAASAARAASEAGCTSVEHGAFVTDDVFRLMVKNGTYYDPNIGLVLQNYIANKEKYIGIGNYNDEGFADMVKGEAIVLETFKRALKIPGLKIIYGTDAVAGAHGRNGEEFIARVQQGGQDPMQALISATSLSAQSLGLGNTTGALAPGMTADIIAMDGDPLQDATAVRRVRFVMKDGHIIKNLASSSN